MMEEVMGVIEGISKKLAYNNDMQILSALNGTKLQYYHFDNPDFEKFLKKWCKDKGFKFVKGYVRTYGFVQYPPDRAEELLEVDALLRL